jgi:crossover junction endodeoxyribonuclease RuvC
LRILGIDPGSISTGYGVVDDNGRRLVVVECGVFHPAGRREFLSRLSEIHDSVSGLISRILPDEVAVENPFLSRNFKSALQLGQARAAAILPAARAGVPVFEYSPREVKMAVVGHGGAEKAQVARMVQVLLSLKSIGEPHDATDALAVAICHAHRSGGLRRLKHQA